MLCPWPCVNLKHFVSLNRRWGVLQWPRGVFMSVWWTLATLCMSLLTLFEGRGQQAHYSFEGLKGVMFQLNWFAVSSMAYFNMVGRYSKINSKMHLIFSLYVKILTVAYAGLKPLQLVLIHLISDTIDLEPQEIQLYITKCSNQDPPILNLQPGLGDTRIVL